MAFHVTHWIQSVCSSQNRITLLIKLNNKNLSHDPSKYSLRIATSWSLNVQTIMTLNRQYNYWIHLIEFKMDKPFVYMSVCVKTRALKSIEETWDCNETPGRAGALTGMHPQHGRHWKWQRSYAMSARKSQRKKSVSQCMCRIFTGGINVWS